MLGPQADEKSGGVEPPGQKSRRVELSSGESEVAAARALVLFQFCSRAVAPTLTAWNRRVTAELRPTARAAAGKVRSPTLLLLTAPHSGSP